MQTEGYHMVIVVDEFGTVIGLATLEDVIEEVVGEIFDRGETDPVQVVDADTAVVNGWATIDYVNESLGLDLQTDGPFETIAGLVTYHAGRLPAEGERVELGDAVITVLDATQRRVRRVRIDWIREDGEQLDVEEIPAGDPRDDSNVAADEGRSDVAADEIGSDATTGEDGEPGADGEVGDDEVGDASANEDTDESTDR
ncbi:MAG: transporter associated domain-containing protein, partial [Halolamina sp.]